MTYRQLPDTHAVQHTSDPCCIGVIPAPTSPRTPHTLRGTHSSSSECRSRRARLLAFHSILQASSSLSSSSEQAHANAPATSNKPQPAPELCGIGVSFFPDAKGRHVINAVAPYSSAQRANVRVGDILLKCDGVDMQNKKPSEVFEYLVGPVSTEVVLKLASSSGLEKMLTVRRTKLPRRRQTRQTLVPSLMMAGQYDKALAYLQRELDEFTSAGDDSMAAEAFVMMGVVRERLRQV